MKNIDLSRRKFMRKSSAGVLGAAMLSTSVSAVNSPDTLALKGGTPVRKTPYASWPQTGELDEKNILKSLRNHKWCTFDGEFIPQFEKAWAEKMGTRGAVITPCGTHALQLAMGILDIGPGDEVLTSPYSYIATYDAIMMSYALPVFVDTDPNTFQMDPDDIEHRITEHTRAIMPVHIYGNCAHMDKINKIAKKHGLYVIEDACQAHMVEWKGKKIGSLGTVGCFSFQESKILPGGEAGALVSNDMELIRKSYAFRDFGRDPEDGGNYTSRGFKYRISDFAASILMAQLTRFDKLCEIREKNVAYLTEALSKIPGITPQQHYPESNRQTSYVYGLRYDSAHFDGLPKAKFIEAMNAEGIPLGGGYRPHNKMQFVEHTLMSRAYQSIYSKERLDRYRRKNNCPNNDKLCMDAMTLPQTVLIGSRKDVDDVIEAIGKVRINIAKI